MGGLPPSGQSKISRGRRPRRPCNLLDGGREVVKPLRPRRLGQLPCKGSLSRTAKPSAKSLPIRGRWASAAMPGGALDNSVRQLTSLGLRLILIQGGSPRPPCVSGKSVRSGETFICAPQNCARVKHKRIFYQNSYKSYRTLANAALGW